jgi:hypothetical protein
MKRSYLYHYAGLALLAFLAYGTIRYAYEYMSLSLIKTVFSYGTYIGYVVLPIAVGTGVLAVYLIFVRLKSRLDWLYVFSWVLVIMFTVVLHFYFQSKLNDLEVVVRNLSQETMKGVDVRTRNIRLSASQDVRHGDSLVFDCKCRKATENDSIGIRLSYQGKLNVRTLSVISPNEPVYRQRIYILIVNDSMSFVNHDIGGQWIGLEDGAGVYTTKQVYALAGKN